MAVNGVQDTSHFQIIQSTVNRQRIDEQNTRNNNQNEEQLKIPSQQEQEQTLTSFASALEYESAYQAAQEEMNVNKSSSNRINAYQSVQNQDRREAFSEMLGVSVYA